jgi:hypothetical protein
MNLVFIVGTGRCGSTLVHEVLGRHPDCGFISNIEDNMPLINRLGRWNNSVYRSFIGQHTVKKGPRFAPSEAYNLVDREVSSVYSNSRRDLTADDVTPWLERRFQSFFGDRAEAQGRQLFTHKYTGWSRMGFFSRIFPQAKFIHIVRDGRAVANSWLQMDWWKGYRGPEHWQWGPLAPDEQDEWNASGQDFIVLAGICWKKLMRSFSEAQAQIPHENFLELRFEEVVEAPRLQFEKMLAFCGLEWRDEFEQAFRRQVFKLDRRRPFEIDLDPKQLERLTRSLQPTLAHYGYK